MSLQKLIDEIIKFNHLTTEQVDQCQQITPIPIPDKPSLVKAKQFILRMIEEKRKMVIYGDYDVDGICATSILYLTLKHLEADVTYYIPNRFSDGYGITLDFVDTYLKKGYDCFILVDNGVSALDVLHTLKTAFAQTLIIDHHYFEGHLPCDVLVHAQQFNSPYDQLCSSALTQIISQHLCGFEPYYATLAGIASIADMMPVWGYNRTLIKEALKHINQKRYRHINQLLSEKQTYHEQDLSFQLIPKLNAVGRLVEDLDVNELVKYLSYSNFSFHQDLKIKIEEINQKRKDLHHDMLQIAMSKVRDESIICVVDPQFHEGVVGITAGQLARQYKRPALVLHQGETRLKGSGRSYGKLDLLKLLEPLRPLMDRLGGHASAIGLEIDQANYEAFFQALSALELPHSTIKDDYIMLDPSWCDIKVVEGLDSLRPFGQGFVIPLYKIVDFTIKSIEQLKGAYRLHFIYHNKSYEGIYFSREPLDTSKWLSASTIYAQLSINEYRNRRSLKFIIDRFE